MAEIVRAGVQAVDPGQNEAAAALGMSRGRHHAAHRPAAGDAGDHPPDRQRDHRDAQGHLAADRRPRDHGALLPAARDRVADLPDHPDGRRHHPLVPGAVQRADARSVLSREAVRPRLRVARDAGQRAAAARSRWGVRIEQRHVSDRRGRPTPGPMVLAEAVHKSFGATRGAQGHRPGGRSAARSSCIIGPSGSGKSTFLRCINHLENIDAGRLWVDGDLVGYREKGGKLHELRDKEVATQRRDIGMVFQRFNLFPHMTALENVIEAPVPGQGRRKDDARARGVELLDRVGLGDRAHAYPNQLSGGQQQRVAIARALAMEPKLMLFDEPTSALDPELVGEVLDVMRGLAADGMTMVVVTHEMGFAREVGDTRRLHGRRRGRRGRRPREVLSNPQHDRTQAFLSKVLWTTPPGRGIRACRRRGRARPGGASPHHRAHPAGRGQPVGVALRVALDVGQVVVVRRPDHLGRDAGTTEPGGTWVPGVTTAPAATIEPEPMCAPFITTLPMPTRTSSSTRAPCSTTRWPTVTPRPMTAESRDRSAACSRPARWSPRRSRWSRSRPGRPRRTRCSTGGPCSRHRPPRRSARRRRRGRSWRAEVQLGDVVLGHGHTMAQRRPARESGSPQERCRMSESSADGPPPA